VNASGPAATVTALFGSAQSPGVASSQPLPKLPAALAGLVTTVYGGDDTRPAERPLGVTHTPDAGGGADGTLTVAQARSMYGTVASTATPSSTGPIIATLQFTTTAVIDQAIDNVDTYEQDNGLYADSSYLPSTNIAAVDVPENCSEGTTDHSEDGDEVGLDQETLLTVAPQFRQRIYYAKNCGNSQDDALGEVLSDVQGGAPIVALSTSWGECEAFSYDVAGGAQAKQSDLDAVDSLLAAGVTIFAASGDNGSNDCYVATARDAVDTPAAIPGVVAVGGTTGTNTAALTVWNNSTGAAGGGFSCGYFARPTYQATVAKAATYPHDAGSQLPSCPAGSSERMVPDISEDAGDGLYAVVTDSYQASSAHTYRTGILGTSFAAPLAAGGFATALLDSGITAGIGDIHGFLYAGHGFHDVAAGSNGDYRAAAGYDVASGVGSPVWPQVIASGSDLAAVSVTSDGAVQVRSAYAGDTYAAASGELTSGLTVSDPAEWQFVLAPCAADRAADLWAIELGPDGHQLEVLSQASGYRTVIGSAGIGTTLDSDQVQARIASYAGDHHGDLYLIQSSGTASRRVEVDLFAATSQYRQGTRTATALTENVPDMAYLVGDKAGSGDLVTAEYGGTSSGRTVVRILSRASGYRTYTTAVVSALPTVSSSPSVQFTLRDVTGDGVPDLEASLVDATGTVQMHALRAPSFTAFAAQRLTGLTGVPTSGLATLALAEDI
jgi:hypothetical protein